VPDFQGRYRCFQVKVNDRMGETNAKPREASKVPREKNEPIGRDFPHLQVETRMRAPMTSEGEQSGQENNVEAGKEDRIVEVAPYSQVETRMRAAITSEREQSG